MSVDGVTDSQKILQKLVALLRDDGVEEAASLYSRLSEDVGYFLVQKLTQDARLSNRLAKMFYVAKDFEKSALVFEESGEYEKAARLYEKADDYGMAAEMFAKIENWQAAAQMYEKHGNFDTAAELYQKVGDLARAAANFEKAVNNFRAGKTYYELGKHEKAVELLQKIGSDHEYHVEAVLMVNKVMASGGYRSIAIRKLDALLQEHGLAERTLDVALTLAENLLLEGEPDQAKEWVERVLEVKFPYKNAGDLLKQIEAGPAPVVAVDEAPEIIEDSEPIEEIEVVEELEDSGPIMALEEEFETIRDAPIFSELNLQELKKFWTLTMPLDFTSGEVIIEQDEAGTGLYIVSSGKVRVVRVHDDGNEETLAELDSGAHLGEMSLLDDSPTSARVVAIEDVDTFLLPKDAFQQLIHSDDRLARKIYQAFAATLMGRLRETNEKFRSFKEKQEEEMADIFGIKG